MGVAVPLGSAIRQGYVPPAKGHYPIVLRWRRRLRAGMKVYTRTGDDGTTGLLYSGRVRKDDVGPEAYGAVDEAVSALGLARATTEAGSELHELLVRLQRELFVVGAELATAPDNRSKLKPEVSL